VAQAFLAGSRRGDAASPIAFPFGVAWFAPPVLLARIWEKACAEHRIHPAGGDTCG